MESYLLHKNPHNLISHFVLLCCQYFSPLVLSKRASHINHSFLLACGHFYWPWYWTSISCWLEGIVGHIETIDSTLSTGKSTCNVYQNRPLVACFKMNHREKNISMFMQIINLAHFTSSAKFKSKQPVPLYVLLWNPEKKESCYIFF